MCREWWVLQVQPVLMLPSPMRSDRPHICISRHPPWQPCHLRIWRKHEMVALEQWGDVEQCSVSSCALNPIAPWVNLEEDGKEPESHHHLFARSRGRWVFGGQQFTSLLSPIRSAQPHFHSLWHPPCKFYWLCIWPKCNVIPWWSWTDNIAWKAAQMCSLLSTNNEGSTNLSHSFHFGGCLCTLAHRYLSFCSLPQFLVVCFSSMPLYRLWWCQLLGFSGGWLHWL